ncbi:hypothetical protein NDU88_005997 [Pleurodeles waltl]|uniref:Uncharacterized protein n=1 Tax=Pleurodeles waltl TaxID=8319 RepID=A0AAV7NNZ5_PLEWA|nr:hypothetical protein NDU88_005997 [Pleurodeles waltl]
MFFKGAASRPFQTGPIGEGAWLMPLLPKKARPAAAGTHMFFKGAASRPFQTRPIGEGAWLLPLPLLPKKARPMFLFYFM